MDIHFRLSIVIPCLNRLLKYPQKCLFAYSTEFVEVKDLRKQHEQIGPFKHPLQLLQGCVISAFSLIFFLQHNSH